VREFGIGLLVAPNDPKELGKALSVGLRNYENRRFRDNIADSYAVLSWAVVGRRFGSILLGQPEAE
jgi:hypothetical protein